MAALPSIVTTVLVVIQLALADDIRPPFRVVWNYPDTKCHDLQIDFELDKFHIEHNTYGFVEDTIALFYSGKAGKWPYIDFKNNNMYIHGGLPTEADYTGHIKELKSAIERFTKSGEQGFGIIDMENWRPVLTTNWGRYKPYKAIFAKKIAKENPDLSRQDQRGLANSQWLNASLWLMVSSIEAAKESRPDKFWGYYGYPELVSRKHHGKLTSLWRAITAYYPSIYISSFKASKNETRKAIMKDIAESFRVRAKYGNTSHPIMVYTMAQSASLGLFYGDWLQMEIRLPLEMGVDGLILWASSRSFTKPKINCVVEYEFVNTTLGPLIDDEFHRMTRCSQQLCAARGRCVKKEYADEFPYLQSRGVPDDIVATATPSGVDVMDLTSVEDEFRSHFVCQCYDGATGDRCTESYRP